MSLTSFILAATVASTAALTSSEFLEKYVTRIDSENRANEALICSIEAKVYSDSEFRLMAEKSCNERANKAFDEMLAKTKF